MVSLYKLKLQIAASVRRYSNSEGQPVILHVYLREPDKMAVVALLVNEFDLSSPPDDINEGMPLFGCS